VEQYGYYAQQYFAAELKADKGVVFVAVAQY